MSSIRSRLVQRVIRRQKLFGDGTVDPLTVRRRLALLVALRDQGRPLPAGAVALSPATDLAATGESLKTREPVDPFFAGVDLGPIIRCYTGSHDPRDPLVSPLYADLRDLPPLLLHVGDNEVLLDDTVRFGERAAAAGVEVRTVVWPGMCHVFQTFSPFVPEARRANAEIAEFVRSILGARKPER